MVVPTIEQVKNANDTREERIEDQITMASPSVVLVIARLAYAASAFGITYVGGLLLGLEDHYAKEVAILNAGVAYYTHEAAGKVVEAINALYRRLERGS